MKKSRKLLTAMLCVCMMGSFSACIDLDSQSNSSSQEENNVSSRVTKEEWESAFQEMRTASNITRTTRSDLIDENLQVTEYTIIKTFIDGKKAYVEYGEVEDVHLPDSEQEISTTETYMANIDGVDYYYSLNKTTLKWERAVSSIELQYTLDEEGIDVWLEAYDEMTYNEETGVYRVENKIVTFMQFPYTMYYMEIEFRDGKIYRVEFESDYVKAESSVDGEVTYKLDGRCHNTSIFENYGATKVVLPEVEE